MSTNTGPDGAARRPAPAERWDGRGMSPTVAKRAAEAVIRASYRTGDPAPDFVYEIAGETPPWKVDRRASEAG